MGEWRRSFPAEAAADHLVRGGAHLPRACKEMGIASRTSLVCVCLIGVAASTMPAQGQVAPLPVEEALHSSTFAPRVPTSLSSDGQWVAFTLNQARKFRNPDQFRYSRITPSGAPVELTGSEIWIVNTRTGELRNITEGEGTSWLPVWSPNGESLAFYSDRGGGSHLWIWQKSSGVLRQVSSARVNSGGLYAGAQWTPDSRRVVLRVLPE